MTAPALVQIIPGPQARSRCSIGWNPAALNREAYERLGRASFEVDAKLLELYRRVYVRGMRARVAFYGRFTGVPRELAEEIAQEIKSILEEALQ